MATARDMIKAALRRIGILASGEEVSAHEAVDALQVLNDMGASFDARDVHTGWSDLSLSDEVILDERHHEGLKAMLAERLCMEFGRPVPAELAKQAYNGWLLMCADYRAPEKLRMDDGIRIMPAQRMRW